MANNGVEGSNVGEEEVENTSELQNVTMKLERANKVYSEYGGIQDKPNKGEVMLWCFYGLSSYFIHTVVIPILFPLIISQISNPPEPKQGWDKSFMNITCTQNQMQV